MFLILNHSLKSKNKRVDKHILSNSIMHDILMDLQPFFFLKACMSGILIDSTMQISYGLVAIV
jgi:hypothetical protein